MTAAPTTTSTTVATVPAPTTVPGDSSGERATASAPTTVRLVVRVGGVLPRPLDAFDLVAELRCGPEEVSVRLDPASPAEYEQDERLVLDDPGRCTAGVTGDAPALGAPALAATDDEIEVRINGERVDRGSELAFWPPAGDEGEVLVEVTYGPSPAGGIAAATPGGAGAGPRAWSTAGLGLVFVLGLAGSIWASRRKSFVSPQER
ncbi:MAG: hypothetical protein GEV08_09605 [Acidimicrobiia bacterium]|nr:hypothetical protein [Acidimicrobiia bacterium]